MKTITKLFMIGLLMSISAFVSGQHTYARWSGSVEQYFPMGVHRTMRGYHGYNWMTTERIERQHGSLYIVTMRRGTRVVELTLNHHGRVVSKKVYHYSPRRIHKYSGRYTHGYGNDGFSHRDRPVYQHHGVDPDRQKNGKPRQGRWN